MHNNSNKAFHSFILILLFWYQNHPKLKFQTLLEHLYISQKGIWFSVYISVCVKLDVFQPHNEGDIGFLQFGKTLYHNCGGVSGASVQVEHL